MAVSPKISWLLKMAWRDSRRNRSRLVLFGSAIILGIAAQVAIWSLGDNLRKNVDQQAAILLGADLEISSGKPATTTIEKIIDSVALDKSEERSFASMAIFPNDKGSRLVQVRALKGAYPFYGKLETLPTSAERTFRNKQAAIVDKSLMIQYGLSPGDSVQIGDLNFALEGSLLKAPGQSGLSATIAPVIYVPMQFLEETGLMQKGSRINYRHYLRYKPNINSESLIPNIKSRLELEGFWYETIESEKEDTGRSFQDLTEYLQLVGFIALLLGCIGVISAIHIYVREKIATIAILRCVGAKSWDAFFIFLIQVAAIGAVCSVIGAIFGTLLQYLLPLVLQDIIPFKISTSLSPSAILQGILLGIFIAVLFALLPLLKVREISPLNTLRMSYQHMNARKGLLEWVIWLIISLFLFGLMYIQLGNWMKALIFMGGIALIFLVLSAVAALLMWCSKKFFPTKWSYIWRQGILNLYRPNNQTLILIVAIGFGTAFICTLFFIQDILVNRVSRTAANEQPNIVLFDIQSTQRNEIHRLAQQHGMPQNPMVPIVNMRLEQVNGQRAVDVQEDTTRDMAMRLFSREYRVTFRDSTTSSETIVEGKWRGVPDPSRGTIYISLEKGFASRFDLKLGDTLVFNVQGSIVETIIGSFREVDWNRIQANFLVVFPTGVLEEAPQFHVYMAHASSDTASANFQQDIVKHHPNVSIIDLALVLNILDEVMSKISFMIRFIAGFSILTGFVVLVISVLISKYQRMQENVLLRTLGASGRQVLLITALEYLFLGSMAAAAGILVALGSSWALAHYNFDTDFSPDLLPIFVVFIFICLSTVIIGLWNSRIILRKPPLEVLRQEI